MSPFSSTHLKYPSVQGTILDSAILVFHDVSRFRINSDFFHRQKFLVQLHALRHDNPDLSRTYLH